jgi:hypothetical protein
MILGDWISGGPAFLFPKSIRYSQTKVSFVLGLAYALFFQITFALAAKPPDLIGRVAINMVSPTPISPSGTETTSSAIFSWIQTKDADTYVVWYVDGKGQEHIDTFPVANLDCSPSTLVCKTKSAITISEGMGEWAVRASKGTDINSDWSKSKAFGKHLGSIADRCVLPEGSSVLTGDLNSLRTGSGEWSVGTAVQAQAIRYDFAKKQAGFNNGLGAGASFRYYRDVDIGSEKNVPVSRIKQDCRASTFRLKNENTVAAPLFSITPTIFVSKLDDTSDLIVQPALMLGFFEDILNVGVGFNLTGRQGEVGNVFLLMSLGMGFQF